VEKLRADGTTWTDVARACHVTTPEAQAAAAR
jgi:hypothetical protein